MALEWALGKSKHETSAIQRIASICIYFYCTPWPRLLLGKDFASPHKTVAGTLDGPS
jgi:hypothetical protein